MSEEQRWAILVVGMHRSGTSAVTRALNYLGADLPLRLMPGNETNPLGHFEPEEIVLIHDRTFLSLGTSWWDWRKFPAECSDTAAGKKLKQELIRAVRREFGASRLFVL